MMPIWLIIADLRPESHQLSLFKGELQKILDAGAFDHTIASFWYFVILSEVLLALKKEIEFRATRKSQLFAEALEIEQELTKLGISESGDFTARINRLSSYVIDEIKARGRSRIPILNRSRTRAFGLLLMNLSCQFRRFEQTIAISCVPSVILVGIRCGVLPNRRVALSERGEFLA